MTSLETFILGIVFLGAQTPNCFALMDLIGDRTFDRIGNKIKQGMESHRWVSWK